MDGLEKLITAFVLGATLISAGLLIMDGLPDIGNELETQIVSLNTELEKKTASTEKITTVKKNTTPRDDESYFNRYLVFVHKTFGTGVTYVDGVKQSDKFDASKDKYNKQYYYSLDSEFNLQLESKSKYKAEHKETA